MDHEKVSRIRDVGVDAILAKPLDPETLIDEILSAIGKSAGTKS
jgi:AmiR/NasT family two-component response regulator